MCQKLQKKVFFQETYSLSILPVLWLAIDFGSAKPADINGLVFETFDQIPRVNPLGTNGPETCSPFTRLVVWNLLVLDDFKLRLRIFLYRNELKCLRYETG